MKTGALKDKRILILGLGVEGQATYKYLRQVFPDKILGLADQKPLENLDPQLQSHLEKDRHFRLHLGEGHLSNLTDYDVIFKTPGIPARLDPIRKAGSRGCLLSSLTELFFDNCPGTIVGVTGTKGKSTTASSIFSVLREGRFDVHLVGNIGVPPLQLLGDSTNASVFVYELSSHQLEGLGTSPHIAILQNVVPEHLDYYKSFEQYVAAKANITRFQTEDDYFIYNAAYPVPQDFVRRTKAKVIPFAIVGPLCPGAFLENGYLTWCSAKDRREEIIRQEDVPLIGTFNLQNVLPAVVVGRLFGMSSRSIARGIRSLKPLPHRLEPLGTYKGIKFYDDSIATVPEATIGAVEALRERGDIVGTLLLGGFDRGLDFSSFAQWLLNSNVKTIILFDPSGRRMLDALLGESQGKQAMPKWFLIRNMEEAVELAFEHTDEGKVCLLSPASPSFGAFRDYAERGETFSRLVRSLGETREIRSSVR